MSNPHTRGHYLYQNDAERTLDPADNVSEHAVNRMDRMPRSAIGSNPLDKDPAYRTAPEVPRQEEASPSPSNYAAHPRGFGRRENPHSGAAGPQGDSRYEPVRPNYGPWQEPAIRRSATEQMENWRNGELQEAMDNRYRPSHYGPRPDEAPRYDDGPAAAARTLPVRERKGPRNYVRSDERIRDEICERLVRDPRLEVGEVSVEVKDGTVLLSGTVPERRMKHAVEDIVDDCWGVTDIENRLRVARHEIEADGTPSVWRNRLGKEA